jgi:EmrB/QacA subfamily drug resistance transporter
MSVREARRTHPNRPGLALAVLCAMQLMIVLDGTIVAVALPRIQADLGFSSGMLSWVMNGYLVAFAGLLMVSGRLGDLLGAGRLFRTGLVVFTASSALCGIAETSWALVLGRAFQGVGGALASAVILGMIVRLFPAPVEQAKAIGAYSFVSAAGSSIGFVAGGLLTQGLGWQWDFFVNVPIGVLAVIAGARYLPKDHGSGSLRQVDLAGAALGTSGLSAMVYAISRVADVGWSSLQTSGLLVVALAVLASFVVRQTSAEHPMLPLRIFRNRQLTVANLVGLFVFAMGFGFQFTTALVIQRVLGYGPLETGLAFLPTPVVIGVVSLGLSAALVRRFGPERLMVLGLAVTFAVLLWLGRLPDHADYFVHVLPALILAGLGMSLVLPSMSMSAMNGVAPEEAATASGLLGTTQQVGAALGLAVLTGLASAHNHGGAGGVSSIAGLLDGYRVAYQAAAGFALAALAIVVLSSARRRAEPHVAAQPMPSECPAS